MTPERWAQIENLFHRAAEGDVNRRTSLLDKACNGDLELRREVEELLAYEGAARDRVQAAIDSEMHDFGFSMFGEVVSHYRVLDAVGGGGMGLVYKAEDLRLGRRVALKFLPEGSANDPAAMARFEREARAASALEHANICSIHEFGEHEGRSFLVMQLLEGQTLRELLARTKSETSKVESSASSSSRHAIPLNQVVDLAIQIANGLEAAHQKGIIHRDIKPANIFVTSQGQAKILDFGLAKLARGATEETDESEYAHLTGSSNLHESAAASMSTPEPCLSRTGVAMGTAGYMSPEQARGEKLDARTDLFSFGLVLHEMATGERAFEGEIGPALHTAIFTQTPVPVRQLNAALPAKLEQVISKALNKNRDNRYQTVSEMRTDLEIVKREIDARNRLRWWIPASAAMVGLLIVSVLYWFAKRQPLSIPLFDRPVSTNTAQLLTQLTATSAENSVVTAAMSPDGKYLVYGDRHGLKLKSLETGETRSVLLPDVSGSAEPRWLVGAWFPDSTRFLANAHPFDAHPFGTWNSNRTSVWLFSILGDAPRKLRDDATGHSVTPDGSTVLFGTHFGAFGDLELWRMDSTGNHARKLFGADPNHTIGGTRLSSDGKLVLYEQFSGLSTSPTIMVRSTEGGLATPLFAHPVDKQSFMLVDYKLLADGRFIYSLLERHLFDESGSVTCNLWQTRLDLHSGSIIENPRRLTNWTDCAYSISSTTDGKKFAVVMLQQHSAEYLVGLEAHGTRIRSSEHFPETESWQSPGGWTADSKAIIFFSTQSGRRGIYKQSLDADTAQRLVALGSDEGVSSIHVTSDGEWVLYRLHEHFSEEEDAQLPHEVMRVSVYGGLPQHVFTLRPSESILCGRFSLCVTIGPTGDQKRVVVTEFDPLRGRGRELTRIDVGPNEIYYSDLSPDGKRIAMITRGTTDSVYIASLRGEPALEIHPNGWNQLNSLAWTADGADLFVSANNGITKGSALLRVDRQGKAILLWEHGDSLQIVPSPDGHLLALYEVSHVANVWTIDNL